MTVTVKIPPPLRSSVHDQKELELNGESIRQVLQALVESYPSSRQQLFNSEGDLNSYVNLYLNDEDIRLLNGLNTSTTDGDVVIILPAMAGG